MLFRGLRRGLEARRLAVARRPALGLGLGRDELVARVPMFAGLAAAKREAITRLLRPRLTVPGEVVVRQGGAGDAMFFISSGAVEVRIAPVPVRLGSGQFFGELALLEGRPRNASVVSLGFCQLLCLSKRDFDRVLALDSLLREEIETAAEARRVRA